MENLPTGTLVGTFTTVDPNVLDTHVYSLVSGVGDSGNIRFFIDGETLVTNSVFDFESASSHSIRVRTTDPSGLFTESQLKLIF